MIDVLLTVNEKYFKYLFMPLCSILDHTKERIHFHIVTWDTDLVPDLSFLRERNCEVDLYKIELPHEMTNYFTTSGLDKITYLRYFLDLEVPLNEVLYIDTDFLFLNDIKLLHDSINKTLMFSCPTPFLSNNEVESKQRQNGLLFFNLKYMREYNFQNKFFQYLKSIPKNDPIFTFSDEKVFSSFCLSNNIEIGLIDGGWDFYQGSLLDQKPREIPENVINNRDLLKNYIGKEAFEKINAIHYNFNSKPWLPNIFNPDYISLAQKYNIDIKTKFRFLEKKSTGVIPVVFSTDTLLFPSRVDMFKGLMLKDGVELGSHQGDFYSQYRTFVTRTDLVDIFSFVGEKNHFWVEGTNKQLMFEAIPEDYIALTDKYKDDKSVEIIKSTSEKYLVNKILKKEKLDWIYIDDDHSYDNTKRNLQLASKVSSRFIMGHDFATSEDWFFFEVVRALDWFLDNNPDWEPYAIALDDQYGCNSFCLKKKGV